MKLFYSTTSPYARKVVATAHEVGVFDRLDKLSSAPHPIDRDRSIIAANPLGKVPTLVTDAGDVLYDSRVICEYLDSLSTGRHVFPRDGAERWRVLTQQALGDGILDAALLIRYEGLVRPPEQQSERWRAGQYEKITDGLRVVEGSIPALGDEVTIGGITIGAALGFLDFRFADFDWRQNHPRTAEWFARFDSKPAMAATRPVAPPATPVAAAAR